MTSISLPLPRRPVHPTGVWSWITTVDHKRIGILYGVTAFILFLTGGLEALYMRAQLARPGQDVVSPEVFNQLFTMHGTTMIFLAIMPDGSRLLQLHHTVADRRQGRSVPKTERVQLLDVPCGRDNAQAELVHGRRAERRLVRLCANNRLGV